MSLRETEQKNRVDRLLSDPKVPSDLKQYLHYPSPLVVEKVEQYISQIERGKIKMLWSGKIDPEVEATLAQIYPYPTALTSRLIQLVERALAQDNQGASWGGYAWDLAWMSTRVGVEIPYGTIVFPCHIGEEFTSFACTFVPSMGCFVLATLPEILGTP